MSSKITFLSVIIIAIVGIVISKLHNENISTVNHSDSQISLEILRKAACDSDLLSYRDTGCQTFHSPNENNCQVAVSFASMIDLRVRLSEFIKFLDPPQEAKYHTSITNRQEFVETLASCFIDGTAAEFRVDKATYDEILAIIEKIHSHRNLGGNAMMMAMRLAQEGCKTFLSSPLTLEMTNYFHSRLIPLNDLIEVSDYHIVFEYAEGETWGKFAAPRSNRFYANHDIENTHPKAFSGLEKLGTKVNLVAIGGLQLIQGSEHEKEFIKSMIQVIDKLNSQKVKIHVEMGDFHNNQFYEDLQKIFIKADSIGLNEQELGKLLSYLTGEKYRGYPSKATLEVYLPDLERLITVLKQKGFQANRIHLHTIYSQVVCSSSDWSDPLISASRSALLSGQYACNTTDIQLHTTNFYRGTVKIHSENAEQNVDFGASKVTHCWNPISEMKCCLALVPTCTKVVQVTALGDNISATGLAFHNILNQV